MSNCKIQIIANSTFSYWAAYLSNSLVKIYPAKWIHGIENRIFFLIIGLDYEKTIKSNINKFVVLWINW